MSGGGYGNFQGMPQFGQTQNLGQSFGGGYPRANNNMPEAPPMAQPMPMLDSQQSQPGQFPRFGNNRPQLLIAEPMPMAGNTPQPPGFQPTDQYQQRVNNMLNFGGGFTGGMPRPPSTGGSQNFGGK